MIAVVDGVRILLSTFGSHVVALACLADVGVDDDLTVDGNLDVVALHYDLLLAPLAERLVNDPLGRNDAINGAVYLILVEVGIHGSVMVKDLTLAHCIVCSVDVERGTDTHAVVHAFFKETELETIDEVPVLLLGIEVSAEVRIDVDGTVHGSVSLDVTYSSCEVLAVEQEHEALCNLLGSQRIHERL